MLKVLTLLGETNHPMRLKVHNEILFSIVKCDRMRNRFLTSTVWSSNGCKIYVDIMTWEKLSSI